MQLRQRSIVSEHPLASYFVLAFLISWAFALPLLLSTVGAIPTKVSPYLHSAVLSGPLLSAVIVTAITKGRHGVNSLLSKLVDFRIGLAWLFTAILSPVIILVLALLLLSLSGADMPDLALLGRSSSLPGLGVAATVAVMLIAAIEEEVGWRGFALPRLQASRSAFASTILLSLIWFAWHLPMFWYRPTFASPTPFMFVGVFLGLLAGAIILTWLFNSTAGSLPAVILWHGIWSSIAASDLGDLVPAVMSVLFMVWAVVIVLVFKRPDLSRSARVTSI
jgi:membrane protease YdiL (CAAX protease family)